MNNSNTTQIIKHFSIAVDQSQSHASTIWPNYHLSPLFHDFAYFFKTPMKDSENATEYLLKAIELSPLDKKCRLCLNFLIDSQHSIHTTNCKHRFHTDCINKWYRCRHEKSCPCCGQPQR